VHTVRVNAGGETGIEVPDSAHDAAGGDLLAAYVGIQRIECRGQLVERLSALLDVGHVNEPRGHCARDTRIATLAHRHVAAFQACGQIPSLTMDNRVDTGLEATGVTAADSALERLRDVESAPLDEHVEIFDDVQRRLHDGLAELDDEQ
jgi:hypothetical protein